MYLQLNWETQMKFVFGHKLNFSLIQSIFEQKVVIVPFYVINNVYFVGGEINLKTFCKILSSILMFQKFLKMKLEEEAKAKIENFTF